MTPYFQNISSDTVKRRAKGSFPEIGYCPIIRRSIRLVQAAGFANWQHYLSKKADHIKSCALPSNSADPFSDYHNLVTTREEAVWLLWHARQYLPGPNPPGLQDRVMLIRGRGLEKCLHEIALWCRLDLAGIGARARVARQLLPWL